MTAFQLFNNTLAQKFIQYNGGNQIRVGGMHKLWKSVRVVGKRQNHPRMMVLIEKTVTAEPASNNLSGAGRQQCGDQPCWLPPGLLAAFTIGVHCCSSPLLPAATGSSKWKILIPVRTGSPVLL